MVENIIAIDIFAIVPKLKYTNGIIFCTDKDETMVRYFVLNENEQIFASKYMTVLPTVEELKNELERNQLMYIIIGKMDIVC